MVVKVTKKKGGGNKKKNEIFVDIFERISVTFGANGSPLSSSIDGTIQMKSYLIGNPELKLALNEDLVIGRHNSSAYGAVVFDDCNFHESVQITDFERDGSMALTPPDGEFVVMNYRISAEFRVPFKMFPFVEQVSETRSDIIIKIRADIPDHNYGSNVIIKFPVPKATVGVAFELPAGVVGQTTEFKVSDKVVTWTLKKFPGSTEQTLRAKLTFQQAPQNVKKETGPISLDFEIPMYNCSDVQIRYLRVIERNSKGYMPYRWVRYITHSNSYVCRLF